MPEKHSTGPLHGRPPVRGERFQVLVDLLLLGLLTVPMPWWATAGILIAVWCDASYLIARSEYTFQFSGPLKTVLTVGAAVLLFALGQKAVRDQYEQAHPLSSPSLADAVHKEFEEERIERKRDTADANRRIEKLQSSVDVLVAQSQHTGNVALKQEALQLSKDILVYYQTVSIEELNWWMEADGQEVSNIQRHVWEETHSEADEQTLESEHTKEDLFLDEYQKRFGPRINALQGELAEQGQAKWNLAPQHMMRPPNASYLPMIAGDIADEANRLK